LKCSVPTVAQSQVILSRYALSADEYCSSERGIGKHVVALEFAHESPPYQFILPPSSSDDGINQLTTLETTEASSIPHNTQVRRVPSQ